MASTRLHDLAVDENRETNIGNEDRERSVADAENDAFSKKRGRKKQFGEEDEVEDNYMSAPKPKKKRKKKPKAQTVEMTINGDDTVEIFWASFSKAVQGKLTSLELDDIRVDDTMFITDQMIHTGELDDLPIYLKSVLPRWSKLVNKVDTKVSKGSPILLLVTCAATRATDLVRALRDFKQNGKVTKLFSKHIKIEEQEKYLSENIVHVGVGTPNRVYKLTQSGSLNLSNLKAVVLDWTWRDAKQRRLMDIPEIQQDLVTLLKDVVFPKASEMKTRIGLF